MSSISVASGSRAFCASPRAAFALVVLCLAVYLPGFFALPAVDRDEARFAQASRQMAESGDYVVPRVQDRPRLNKPPLIYWAQAAGASLFTGGNLTRDDIWMYRVPSLLAAIAIVLLTRRIGLAMFDPRTACLAAAFIAVAPVFLWEARQARADMVMIAWTTAAMHALWLIHSRGATTPRHLLLWLAVALGILTKGPITPMIVVLAALSLSVATRRWKWLLEAAPLFGLVMIGVVCLPWLFAVVQKVGPDIYWRTIYDETLGRSVSAKEGHWGPPGYHVVLMPLLLFPGCLCVGAAAKLALKRALRTRREAGMGLIARPNPEVFLFCWGAPSWVVFELVGTKLPHYTMPLYPALALLAARLVMKPRFLARHVFDRPWIPLVIGPWILGAIAVCCAGIAAVTLENHRDGRSLIALAIAIVGIVVMLTLTREAWRSWRGNRFTSLHLFVLALAGLGAVLFCSGLPGLNMLWTSRNINAIIARHDAARSRPLAAVGFQEDSLIFETRGRAQRISIVENVGNVEHANPELMAAWLAANPGGLVVIEERLLSELPALRSLGGTLGFNYSRGRWVHVALAEAAK